LSKGDTGQHFNDDFVEKTYIQLKKLIEPQSVAIIGASNKIDKVGGAITRNVLNSNYQGKVYLVNPKLTTIFGQQAYQDVDEIPDNFDLAEIVVPAEAVPQTIEQIAKKGASGAIVVSAGFAESGNKTLQAELIKAARKNNIRIIGPNCFGIINTAMNLDLTFTFTGALKGSIAFVGQSGAMCCGTLDWAYNRDLGFSKFINIGNESDVDISDVLAFLAHDPQTKVIGIYMEGIKNGRKLIDVGRIVAQKKPIVVLKSGSSEAGARACLSHTGSIAGSDDVVNAALRQAHMLRVDDIEEIFDAAFALSNQPLPNGNRIGIVSNAGGLGVMVSDWCTKLNLQIPIFPLETRTKIKTHLPAIASASNPIDMTGIADYNFYKNVLDIVLSEQSIDCAICIFVSQGLITAAQPARAVAEIASKHDKPVLAFWMGERSTKEGIEVLRRSMIPTYPSPSRVAKAAYALHFYSRFKKSLEYSSGKT